MSVFPASAPRPPSSSARCTCEHWLQCDCACHARACDPTQTSCDLDYLPDEGGLTRWGCPSCTPGELAPHHPACDLIGWNVSLTPTAQS